MLPETYLAPVSWSKLAAALERAGDRATAKHRPESRSQPPLQAPPTAKPRQLLCRIGHGLQRGGFCRQPLEYQRGPAGRATCSSLTMTASWEEGSPPVRSCPRWSTEPEAVPLPTDRNRWRSWLIRSTIATRSRRIRCCRDMWPSLFRDALWAHCWHGPTGAVPLGGGPQCTAPLPSPTSTRPARA